MQTRKSLFLCSFLLASGSFALLSLSRGQDRSPPVAAPMSAAATPSAAHVPSLPVAPPRASRDVKSFPRCNNKCS